MDLDFIWDVTENSDHFSFFQHNIPFLMFHTGLHENYHRPSDDPELINREGMQEVAQLMFEVTYEIAEASQVAPFRDQLAFESNQARAGIRTDRRMHSSATRRLLDSENPATGLLITRVTAGSAADEEV